MFIYHDDGILRADFSNGRGALYYKCLIAADGKSVEFESEPAPGAGTYRMSYKQEGPNILTWTLELKRPDSVAFGLLQTETLARSK
jgi:hypothetical protein